MGIIRASSSLTTHGLLSLRDRNAHAGRKRPKWREDEFLLEVSRYDVGMKRFIPGFTVAMVLAVAAAVQANTRESAGAQGDPAKGKEVFAAQKCSVCHKVNGVGGAIGPDLGGIGLKRDAAWLAKYLPNPAALDPKNPPKMTMQPTTAKGKDLDDLIAYLLTLKTKKSTRAH
jgi:cytochrome c2